MLPRVAKAQGLQAASKQSNSEFMEIWDTGDMERPTIEYKSMRRPHATEASALNTHLLHLQFVIH
jgi:hypothetical protein